MTTDPRRLGAVICRILTDPSTGTVVLTRIGDEFVVMLDHANPLTYEQRAAEGQPLVTHSIESGPVPLDDLPGAILHAHRAALNGTKR